MRLHVVRGDDFRSQTGQPLHIPAGGNDTRSPGEEAFRYTLTGVAATEDQDIQAIPRPD